MDDIGLRRATMTRRRTVLQIDENPSASDVRDLGARLSAFTESYTGRPLNVRKLAVWLRDGDGRLAGGLVGSTYWDWLHIDNLWVDEAFRGRGWGRRILATAERVAVQRGCRGAWLDCRSFQALGFYRLVGYREFGALAELSSEDRRCWLWKDLLEDPRPASRQARYPDASFDAVMTKSS